MENKSFKLRLLEWIHHFNVNEETIFFSLTIVVGIVAGLAAVAFHLSLGIAHKFFFGTSDISAVLRPWYLIPLIPAGGALAAALLLRLIPEARGSGIPQTTIAYIVHNGVIPARVWIGKFVIGVLNIGTGSSLGREGPTIQICAGIASWFGQIFSLGRTSIQSLVPVGAAAGLAAAFNTPISAVTFTLEELVGDLNARVLGSIVAASIAASIVTRAILGNNPAFLIPPYSLNSYLELIPYAIVGVVCAGISVIFKRGLLTLRGRCLHLSAVKAVLITALGGLAIGIIGIWVPHIFAVGYPWVTKALTEGYSIWFFLVLLVLKLVATIISYGTGSSGGIFAPTLFMGAMAGGAVATITDFLFPELIIGPGSYALVGMGAAFAAIVRTPMTSVIMIFELTQDYNIILALMVANSVSFVLSRYWEPEPIYSALSSQDGVQLPNHETEHLLHEIHVVDAMISDVSTLWARMPVKDALDQAENFTFTGFPVVNDDGHMVGIISEADLRQAHAQGKDEEPIIEAATTSYILHAHPDQSLDSVMAKLGDRQISRLPVVSRADPTRLLGIITAEDVMKAFGKTLARVRHDDNSHA
ncbi:MAG: chloride channel protein [Nitrospinaceae bacterium]|jgi:chloride channel protein, CIC family|nr:chloride channel protein [Nitrospinaceae bacterium]MBT3435838.1 chloride channel protein [Nitrospinaceae bacterium]MBT3821096.1 chloride channel protein [Nitrospinaceae bacterium]MBT4093998.1 chloride channel protein [Nitrospinaceae bacterium]MBT4430118.1 chloride channel protein [Nitrospinaceae bacterium]